MKVIVCFIPNHLYSAIVLKRFLEEKENEVIALIESGCLIYGETFFGSVRKLIRVSGFRFFLVKAIEFLFFGLKANKLIKCNSIPLFKVKDINSIEGIKLVRDLKPDLIVSIYFNQVIGKEVISVPVKGCINIHPALLPRYAGISPCFWVLANNEKETGVTVHFIDKGIDSGDIVLQERIKVKESDSMHSLYLRSSVIVGEMLLNAVKLIEEGKANALPQDKAKRSYFSFPSKKAVKRFLRNEKKFF